jgi:cytoskeletal protein CcmA (bactofilin family)
MARLGIFLVAIILALLPAAGYAQVNQASDSGFVMRIDGDLLVQEGESVDSAFVIDGDVQIDGTVEDLLMIIDGTAEITGRVDGDIFTISTDLTLAPSAVVDGDVRMIEGSLDQQAGSRVTGDIDRDFDLEWWQWFLLNIILWVGLTIAVLVLGLLMVAVAPRQTVNAANTMTADPGWSALGAFITFIGVPIVAVLAVITVIGLPLGLAFLIFVLPAVWFVGYLISGVMLGRLIYSRAGDEVRENLYLSAITGLGILQLIMLIPGLGVIIAALLGLWGGGALTLLAWRSFRWPRRTAGAPAAP